MTECRFRDDTTITAKPLRELSVWRSPVILLAVHPQSANWTLRSSCWADKIFTHNLLQTLPGLLLLVRWSLETSLKYRAKTHDWTHWEKTTHSGNLGGEQHLSLLVGNTNVEPSDKERNKWLMGKKWQRIIKIVFNFIVAFLWCFLQC